MSARSASGPLSCGLMPGVNIDRRIGLVLLAVVLLGIVVVSILAPASDDTDPTPTTYNSGSAGAKAVYLLASALGYETARWDAAPASLRTVDAAHTTLILAEPDYPDEDAKQAQTGVAEFLARGGRVLATGAAGAYLLPGGRTANPTRLYQALCRTAPNPANSNPLAQTGPVSISEPVRWETQPPPNAMSDGPSVTVAQRCGEDAVVVSFPYGKGQAVWWSSAMPLTNRGLKEDASLKLVLASLGARAGASPAATDATPRRILFDEYFHGDRATLWETAAGLPIYPLLAQCAFVATLLVLSFGRRNGPLRAPVRIPRTSPIEFAESMGRLYRAANATHAATEAARRRLLQFLAERCGVPREILRGNDPAAIAEQLQARIPGNWSRVAAHLTQAAQSEYANLAPGSALALVRALDQDQLDLAAATRAAQPLQPTHQTPAA